MKALKYLVFTIAWLMLQPVFGQEAKEEFKKVDETFLKNKTLGYEMIYTHYETHTSTTPVETMSGSFRKYGDNQYMKLDDHESISNKKYRLLIDNESKHLIVEAKKQTEVEKAPIPDLDSSLAACKEIKLKKTTGKEIFSLYYNEDYDYNRIDIVIDTKTSFISKIIFYLVQRDAEGTVSGYPRVEVSISNFTVNPAITESFFSETKYVSIDDMGNVKLVKKYADFKLLTPKVSIN